MSSLRRNFLQRASALALATQLPACSTPGPHLKHDPFGLGVASGEPTPDGVVLWTRLLPAQPGMTLGAQSVRWELAHDAGFRQIVQHGEAKALPEWGHSVHVEVAGLAPGRWYFYRFHAGAATSTTGRTRTAPKADELPQQLRLIYASCQRWEHGQYAAWAHAARQHPDLVLFLGDYIYEYATPKDTRGLARVHGLPLARTLADYRARYALHKSDPLLQAAHAACPWAVAWDDHEVENDWAGVYGRAHDAQAFAPQRLAAFQAFYEHMPLRAASLAHGVGRLQVYRRLDWGRLARIQLLDARQFRDWQACRAPGASGAGSVRPDQCADWAAPTRSFLGRTQEAWLDAQLARSAQDAPRWSVIAQQTLFMPRRPPGGTRSTDSWDGYPGARQRLLQSLQRHPQRNTVLLGGDIHQNYVCKVLADPDRPDSAVLASEFCGTSISSRSGTLQARVDAIVRHNPHVLWANPEYRGFGVADVTPGHWTTRLYGIADPLLASSGARQLARFVVEDGHAGPQPG